MRKTVAFLLGQLLKGFVTVALNGNMMAIMNETHFIVNMDDREKLGFL
jgi:hypothetical protein